MSGRGTYHRLSAAIPAADQSWKRVVRASPLCPRRQMRYQRPGWRTSMAKGFTSRPALISEAVMKFGTMAMSWPDRRRQRQEIAVGWGWAPPASLGTPAASSQARQSSSSDSLCSARPSTNRASSSSRAYRPAFRHRFLPLHGNRSQRADRDALRIGCDRELDPYHRRTRASVIRSAPCSVTSTVSSKSPK